MFRARTAVALAAVMGALGAEPAGPRRDACGDPLPPHALARLGTLRFRHVAHVKTVAFSGDGEQILSQGGDARLWDAATGRPLYTLPFVPARAAVALAPDGKALAMIQDDRDDRLPVTAILRLVDLPTGKERWRLSLPDLRRPGMPNIVSLHFLAFSADGALLAVGGTTSAPRLVDARTGRERALLRGVPKPREVAGSPMTAPGGVTALALAPDGKCLAGALGDLSVRLWDAAGGKELRALEGHTDAVNSVAFTPDGKGLVSGGDDGTLRLWDVRTGKDLRRFAGPPQSGLARRRLAGRPSAGVGAVGP